jgi:hypothetical protein
MSGNLINNQMAADGLRLLATAQTDTSRHELAGKLAVEKNRGAEESVVTNKSTPSKKGSDEDANAGGIFAVMAFMIDQINTNSREQIVGAQHMQVVSNNLTQIGDALSGLSNNLTDPTAAHAGTATYLASGAVVLANLFLFPLAALCPPLMAGLAYGDYTFIKNFNQVEQAVGDGGSDPSQQQAFSVQQTHLGLLGSQNNQQMSTDQQLYVTQRAQDSTADASIFSQMATMWGQMASISNNKM